MKQKEFLVIAVTVFLTIVAWMMADIYHIANTEKIKSATPKILKPVVSKIDKSVPKILEGQIWP